jgi:Fic family protein
MGKIGKKSAVFDGLRQKRQAVSIKELLDALGTGYTERSVRRWLSELVEEGIVQKLGEKRGTKYQASLQVIAPTQALSEESKKILEGLRGSTHLREPVTYADEWIKSYVPNKTFYLPLNSRLLLHQLGSRSYAGDIAGTYAHKIFNRLLIDLSYNSSRLEGNTYSLIDTQKLILEGKTAEGKLDAETQMILNHKEAIRHLVNIAPRLKVSEETICTLHYLLASGLIDDHYAGKIRDVGVSIQGSVYLPFENRGQLKLRLQRIVEKAALISDPFEQSLFLLIHLSYLQAFLDVNKRTARLAANIALIKHNFVPLSFNDVEKNDYNGAMIAVYELQEIRPILDLYLYSYTRTCTIYDATIKTMGFDEFRARYRQQRRLVVREVIVKNLHGKAQAKYLTSKIGRLIKAEDREAFKEDVIEDLSEMDANRLVGFGVTKEEFNHWHKRRMKLQSV